MGPYTVATLPTPNASNLGRLAVVTDLWGDSVDRVRCIQVDTGYFWKPSSSDSARPFAANVDSTLTALGAPQSIILTGAGPLVGVTKTITLSPVGGWPGAIKEIRGNMSSILGTLNIAGTGLGSAVALTMGGYKKFALDYSTGVLQWIQLV